MVTALGLGLLLAVLRYGPHGLLRLADLRLHGSALLIAAVLLQACLLFGAANAFWYSLATLLCMGGFLYLNQHLLGVRVAVCGACLNLLVMLAYNGRMPVHPAVWAMLGGASLPAGSALPGGKGVFVGEPSPLLWLGDALPLPGAVSGVALWSLGDLLLLCGLLLLLTQTMRGGVVHDGIA